MSAYRWGILLRDGALLQVPARRYECNTLILGGGAAGLGALWYLAKHNHRDVLLAEGFERNGNNAAYTSSDGLKAPSGAHYLALPSKESVYVREMLADFGICSRTAALGKPIWSMRPNRAFCIRINGWNIYCRKKMRIPNGFLI